MSHTVKMNVKINDTNALRLAAEKLGAQILGQGTHRLYSSTHAGFGVHLKNWKFPLIVDNEGTVHYDNFGGAWGSSEDLEKLKDYYAASRVEAACDQLGWYHEKQGDEVVIHHPSGGTIIVQPGGGIEASNFTGSECEQATAPIEAALGDRFSVSRKAEYNILTQENKQGQS